MTSKKNRARAPKEVNKKFKKKTSVLVTDKVGSATAEQRALEVLRGLVAASDQAQRG